MGRLRPLALGRPSSAGGFHGSPLAGSLPGRSLAAALPLPLLQWLVVLQLHAAGQASPLVDGLSLAPRSLVQVVEIPVQELVDVGICLLGVLALRRDAYEVARRVRALADVLRGRSVVALVFICLGESLVGPLKLEDADFAGSFEDVLECGRLRVLGAPLVQSMHVAFDVLVEEDIVDDIVLQAVVLRGNHVHAHRATLHDCCDDQGALH